MILYLEDFGDKIYHSNTEPPRYWHFYLCTISSYHAPVIVALYCSSTSVQWTQQNAECRHLRTSLAYAKNRFCCMRLPFFGVRVDASTIFFNYCSSICLVAEIAPWRNLWLLWKFSVSKDLFGYMLQFLIEKFEEKFFGANANIESVPVLWPGVDLHGASGAGINWNLSFWLQEGFRRE